METYEALAAPSTTNLSRFHETSAKFLRYKVLLRRRWWFLLLTVAIAVCFEALNVTGKSTQYIALAKIAAGIRVDAQGGPNGVIDQQMATAEFYGTQIEILESGGLQERALERVRGVHPELKEVPVTIRVTQTKGSSILKIAALGEDQKYTRVYLDALLDAYLALRQEMVEKQVGTAMNKVIEEVLSHEKAVKVKSDALNAFLKDNNDISVFEHDRNDAAAYMKQLENTRDVYQTELRLMDKMGQDDYLKAKEQAGNGQPVAAMAPSMSNTGLVQAQGLTAGNNNDVTRSMDVGGGLTRTESEYLKSLNDLQMLQADRVQLLKTFREEHDTVKELDAKIVKVQASIAIQAKASQEEWERRRRAIQAKIDGLSDNIKDAQAKALEMNAKIVAHHALLDDFNRARDDYQLWKKNMDTLENTLKLNNDFVEIMERPKGAVEDVPDLIKPLVVAFVVGLLVGSVILFLFDRLDDRMNSFSEFQTLFPNESILGQIPEQNSRGDVTLIRPNDDRHLYAEAFRNLRSSILFKNWKNGRPPKLILFTSAVPNEGKTTTVANLAVTLALGGARVLLADADLRRGGLNELFKVPATPGFAEVLTSRLHWRDAVQETSTKNLHILPRGEALDQTSELFLAPLTQEILREMGDEYDYVVFDSAPTLVADDTASIAPKMDTVLFIVRMSSTMARLTAKALDILYDRQVNVGGVILNRASTNLKEYTYYNYASYYSISSRKNAEAKAEA